VLRPSPPIAADQPQSAKSMNMPLTVSVVICTYTENRWNLLLRSVASAQHQSRTPAEIFVCVDHNDALLRRCQQQWAHDAASPPVPVVVLANKYRGRVGSARNSAAEVACGDIVAFLDDDAWADPDWLERLLSPYESEHTVAVGGAPMPEFEGTRPGWFPLEFDWVFGCTYAGLPEKQAPLARLIGANMSVRRLALVEIGGFQSDDHDDMVMCHRLMHLRPTEQIVYEPMARVHHFVPTERTTWRYFWRRCFFVNKGKVEAFRQMEGAANLSADLRFVGRSVSQGVSLGLRQTLTGDLSGAARAVSILVGIGLAGAGHVAGQAQWHLLRVRGWQPSPRQFIRHASGSQRVRSERPGVEEPFDSPPSGEHHRHTIPGRQALVGRPVRQIPPTIGQIPFDGAFPEQPVEFIHDLHHDDRLTLESIADLADRLPRRSVIHDTAAQPLLVPQGGPPRGALARPGDVIRDLRSANAWLTLLNVEDDPAFAELMNTMLDQLEPGMLTKQGKMRNRVAFVFVSSPNSVTPVHFDIEHSLLMQVSGSKTLSTGGFESEAVRRHEINRYWDGSHGRIEALPQELATYPLTPGRGVYIPAGVPHWVHNGPDISMSVTLTYFTAASVRENRIEDFNSRLRRFHLNPREPGRSAPVDAAKIGAMGGWALARLLRSGIAGATKRGDRTGQVEPSCRVEGS